MMREVYKNTLIVQIYRNVVKGTIAALDNKKILIYFAHFIF